MDPWINAIEVLLCSAATTLALVAQTPRLPKDAQSSGRVDALRRWLHKLLDCETTRIKALVEMDSERWCADGVPFATREALVAIRQHVSVFRTDGLLSIPDELVEALERSPRHTHSSYHFLLEFRITSEIRSADKV